MNIPIIDIFAGPGGLSEGFSSYLDEQKKPVFKTVLSIEKDKDAHKTLQLRSFYRQFRNGEVPEAFYEYIRGELDRNAMFGMYKEQANIALNEVWQAELGKVKHGEIDRRITEGLSDAHNWVLIGGPPCQAYSLAGRSRMKNSRSGEFENDARHFLYREYLRILRQHNPPVFVMENVKGLLSSTIEGKSMFKKIVRDLSAKAGNTPGYNIYSFVRQGKRGFINPSDYVIESEQYDIPQMRHRVILLGIRKDMKDQTYTTLTPSHYRPTVSDAIGDLPKLRSQLSKIPDSYKAWRLVLEDIFQPDCLGDYGKDPIFTNEIRQVLKESIFKDIGEDDYYSTSTIRKPSDWLKGNSEWFLDSRLDCGVCNHRTRAHMPSDLLRYLFAATFARIHTFTPKLKHYPKHLLPKHENVDRSLENSNFSDRFRVQVAKLPGATVVSHLAKDGHYFIHPDPSQCRSLTVREAARLQTFPDNYFFEGTRTEQYKQVGNAVPPLLARQLAGVVHEIINNNV